MVQTKRIADGQHPITHLQGCGITKTEEGQRLFHVHFEQGQVRLFVRTDELGRDGFALARALVQGHPDNVRVGHHMVVGDDVAVFRDDKAGPQGFLAHLRAFAAAHAELVKEFFKTGRHVAEHLTEDVVLVAATGLALCINIDHGGAAFGGQIAEIGQSGGPGALPGKQQRQSHQSGKVFAHSHGKLLAIFSAKPSAKPVP